MFKKMMVMLVAVFLVSNITLYGQLTVFTDRATFETEFPDLVKEDFEDGNVAPVIQTTCDSPIDENSDDNCFAPGDIEPGVQFAADPNIFGMAIVGAGGVSNTVPINNPTIAAGPNNRNDIFEIIFTTDDVFHVGFDLFDSVLGPASIDIEVFGPGDVSLGTSDSPGDGAFWGVSSEAENITRITLNGGHDVGEVVDNVCFGAVLCKLSEFSLNALGYTFVEYGGPGNDTLNGKRKERSALFGAGGDDTLRGRSEDDLLCGGSGNDILIGVGGNDLLFGGPGIDDLSGGPGNDMLFGEGGRDTLHGGNHQDILDGGRGADELRGNAGSDMLFGRGGADTLFGQSGNDDLDGGPGDDTCNGGTGSDSEVNCE